METEVQQLRCELERTRALYEHLLNSMPDIIYQLDGDGRILYINDAVRRYGYEPSELLGCNMIELVHPADRDKARYRINERRAGERSTCGLELRFATKTQGDVSFEMKGNWEEVESVMLVDAAGIYANGDRRAGKFLATQGIARDVTERTRMENKLRSSEKHFRMLAESVPVPILVSSAREGEILFVNETLCTSFDMSAKKLLGENTASFYADAQQREELVNSILRTGAVDDREIQVKNCRGELFWVSTWSRTISFCGKAAMLTGFYDITTRKKAEVALREVERLRVLSEAAGGAAHEINQPLTGIVLIIEYLLQSEQLDDKVREALGTVDEQVGRIGDIITNMRNVQNYQTRPYALDLHIVDWVEAAGERE